MRHSARSPIAWPPDSFRVGPTVVAVFGAIVVVFASVIVLSIAAMATGWVQLRDIQHNPPRLSTDFILWTQFAIYPPTAAFLLLMLRPLSKLSFRELGFRMPTWNDLAVGALGMVAMLVVVDAAALAIEALTHRHDTEAAIELLKSIHTPTQQVAFVLIAVIAAPLVEELAFRVFLFNAFLRWTPFWVAALGSGLLFGLAHAQSASQILTIGIPLMFGGVVLAFVYDSTRCYWSSLLTHVLFNGWGMVAYYGLHVKP